MDGADEKLFACIVVLYSFVSYSYIQTYFVGFSFAFQLIFTWFFFLFCWLYHEIQCVEKTTQPQNNLLLRQRDIVFTSQLFCLCMSALQFRFKFSRNHMLFACIFSNKWIFFIFFLCCGEEAKNFVTYFCLEKRKQKIIIKKGKTSNELRNIEIIFIELLLGVYCKII